ncbi:MAG: 3' terminal RNA ribose 2'-O-methyltransferase Hen1 [Micropruina sp.]
MLTVTSTAPNARELGFLLHKHPDRVQSSDLPLGTATVFFPEATDERCTVALTLRVDPIDLVRSKRFIVDGLALGQYVNDRPYAASSFLAVALGRVFATALKGRCDSRPELVTRELPLEVVIPVVPTGAGPDLPRRLFEPLGWQVTTTPVPLDDTRPDWGDSRYVRLVLRGELTLAAALNQLYVLLPVLDGSKHYWVAADEVDKLIRAGGDWLPAHPEQELILTRYLARQRPYVTDALERLNGADDITLEVADEPAAKPLGRQRREAAIDWLKEAGARRVIDLGCGEGVLLRALLSDAWFTEIVGVDVSATALQRAEKRLGLERMAETQGGRLRLHQSSATYLDDGLIGFDAVVLMEVLEHLDPDRLIDLERSLFGHARPDRVIVTTPNADYNPRYGLVDQLRHPDHRFEWSRHEFAAWASRIRAEHGYQVELRGVGEADPDVGQPTQAAIFTREVGHG